MAGGIAGHGDDEQQWSSGLQRWREFSGRSWWFWAVTTGVQTGGWSTGGGSLTRGGDDEGVRRESMQNQLLGNAAKLKMVEQLRSGLSGGVQALGGVVRDWFLFGYGGFTVGKTTGGGRRWFRGMVFLVLFGGREVDDGGDGNDDGGRSEELGVVRVMEGAVWTGGGGWLPVGFDAGR
ncbi:uncharacterized protein [Nicotiana sylvestris]|uniref:uncharacterized protein n=1 Tax=Nicotiana sylvestris TaxID=4096 RepID=UPI00388CAB7F